METTETEAVTVLDAEDIAAMRAANSVTCHYNEGKSSIRLYCDGFASDERIYTAREQRLFTRTIDCIGRVRDVACETVMYGYGHYGDTGAWHRDEAPHAAAYCPRIDGRQWRTIAHTLRKGNTLTLRWVADNNNHTLEENGLHRDELWLEVDSGRDTPAVYLLDVSVSYDNTARMIRRNG